MRNILVKTGGFSASHEQFHSNVFTDSMKNFFQLNEFGFIDKCFAGRLEVSLAKGLKVQGIVGPCMSENKKDQAMFTDVAVGEGTTTAWYLGCLDKNTSLALVMANDRQDDSSLINRPFVMQFRTYYKNGYGQMKLRVTTICRNFAGMNKDVYAQGFDQEAAIVMTARCALSLAGAMEQKEITKWIDKRLIKFYARFGDFTRGLPNSFKIGEEFRLVPQFFFYFRKSTFILNFSVSVDEMEYIRMVLMRENVSNCLAMIQPSLLEYSSEADEPEAVLCDISSMKDDIVILFDSYFNAVIW